MKNSFFLLILAIFCWNCSNNPPQYPTTYSNDGFMEYSKKEAKKQQDLEKILIEDYKLNSSQNFMKSEAGFYMTFPKIDSTQLVQPNDTIKYTYKIDDLENNSIYSFEEIGEKNDVFGKSKMIMGIEFGLKNLSPKTETIMLIPSVLAYGKTGDGNKIATDQPLVVHLRLISKK